MEIIGFILLVIGVSAPFVLPYYFVSKLREWGEREPGARELANAYTRFQEARAHLGYALGKLGVEYPYKEGANPAHAFIDPPADIHRAG